VELDINLFKTCRFVAGWTWSGFGIGAGITRFSFTIDLGFLYLGFEW